MKRTWRYYGKGLPNQTENDWPGHLIVMEGSDCCGRSTQTRLLRGWLEQQGYAVMETGLKRSNLVSRMIIDAKQGNLLGRRTLSMLYTTDLADQLENQMIPALRAGFVVLADRYFFTMMARDAVRGIKADWLEKLMGFALVPDAIIYLKSTVEERLHRSIDKYQTLDYWESGVDLRLASDRFTSFQRYQELLQIQYERLASRYGFHTVNGSAGVTDVHKEVRAIVARTLTEGVVSDHA